MLIHATNENCKEEKDVALRLEQKWLLVDEKRGRGCESFPMCRQSNVAFPVVNSFSWLFTAIFSCCVFQQDSEEQDEYIRYDVRWFKTAKFQEIWSI